MNTLNKSERLNKKLIIERMFEGGNAQSFSIFPLRVVYMPVDQADVPVSLMISVSKRHFKHAVSRNRVKRQIREAYRLNKTLLSDSLVGKSHGMAICIIYLADELYPSDFITEKFRILLQRLAEKIS